MERCRWPARAYRPQGGFDHLLAVCDQRAVAAEAADIRLAPSGMHSTASLTLRVFIVRLRLSLVVSSCPAR
jgi:hypothetical protein